MNYGLDTSDENLIAAVHVVNEHGVNPELAFSQSSRSGNDHGIDAWSYHEGQKTLYIYQSKLTDNKTIVVKGLKDLSRAVTWLSGVIIDGGFDSVPQGNPALFNLYTLLSRVRGELRAVHIKLLSPSNDSRLQDAKEVAEFKDALSRSELRAFLARDLDAKLTFDFAEYNLDGTIPAPPPRCTVPVNRDMFVKLGKGLSLDVAYVALADLIDLYRRRGDMLFDKNVRLSLGETKAAKDRLVHPMRSTLDLITKGNLDPDVFALYHVGVTVTAHLSPAHSEESIDLESPSVINGCQTITIAAAYLQQLQKQKNQEAIDRFQQIRVLTKIVVGASDEDTKEITNANNRQNPIENWQLFSNEPVHVDLHTRLKDVGVFYERQKGKYDTLKNCDVAKDYPNTNGTFIKVLDLAQVIALAQSKVDLAAKPSNIFLNQTTHDMIFNQASICSARDVIFLVNVFKALKRALNNYLRIPAQAESNAVLVFGKTQVRMHTLRLALMYFYKDRRGQLDPADYSSRLYKIAHSKLVASAEDFYPKIITKIRTWYKVASNDFSCDVSNVKLNAYFETLATQVGVDCAENQMPFAA